MPTSSTSTYADLQLGHAASRISIFFKDNLILTKVLDLGADSLSLSPDTAPVDEQGLLERVGPALERLTAEIEAVFQYHCGPGKGEPIPKLFVSGPVTPDKAIMNHLSQELKVKMVTVDLLEPRQSFPVAGKAAPFPSRTGLFTPRRWDWLFPPTPAPPTFFAPLPKKRNKPPWLASIGRCFGLL